MVLLVGYIQTSDGLMDALVDYQMWLLLLYWMVLIIKIVSCIYELDLLTLWFKCQSLDIIDCEGIEQIETFHNYIHEQKMIFQMLHQFFGSLSVTIMEYVGMIEEDGSLYIASIDECKERSHKRTIACSDYLFEFDEF